MAEPLGVAQVVVEAEVQGALDAIKKVEAALDALGRKSKLVLEAQEGGKPGKRENETRTREGRELSRTQGTDASSRSRVTPDLQGDIKINVDTRSILAQVQNAFRTYRFKITLDTADINRQLQNLDLRVGVQATGGSGGGSAAPAGPSTQMINAISRAPGHTKDPAQLRAAAEVLRAATGRNIQAPQGNSDAELARFATDAIQALGLSASSDLAGIKHTEGAIDYQGIKSLVRQQARRAAEAGGPSFTSGKTSLAMVAPLITSALSAYEPAPAAPPPPPAPVQQTATAQGMRLEQDRTQRETAQRRMQQQAAVDRPRPQPGPPVTFEDLIGGIEETYGALQPLGGARHGGRPTPQPGTATAYGGGIKTKGRFSGVRFDPKTGEILDVTPKTRGAGDEPYVGGFKYNGIDLTPYARAVSTGALGMFARDNAGNIVPAAYDFDPVTGRSKKLIPEGGSNIGQQEMLERLIRRRIGAGNLPPDVLRQMMKGQRPGEAPLAGAATGYFKPFLEEGNRNRGALARGDMAISHTTGRPVVGDITLGPGLGQPGGRGVANEELAEIQALTGENVRTYTSFVDNNYREAEAEANAQSREAGAESRMQMTEAEAMRIASAGGQFNPQLFEDVLGRSMTLSDVGKAIGARAEIAMADPEGQLHGQFMEELQSVFDALLDPSQMPTHAAETVGEIKEGDPLDRRSFLNYRTGQIMARTGLAERFGVPLGHDIWSTARNFSGVGGGLISSGLRAVGSKYMQQLKDEDEYAKRRAGVEKRKTGHQPSELMGIPQLPSETRMLSHQGALERLTGGGSYKERGDEEALIYSRHLARMAPRLATERANKARDDRGAPTPLPEPSDFERDKTEKEIHEAVLKAAGPELNKVQGRKTYLGQQIHKEERITEAARALVDSVRGTDAGAQIPTQESLDALARSQGIAEDIRPQVIADLMAQTHRQGRNRPLQDAVGETYSVQAQRQGLARGATSTHDIGGQRSAVMQDEEGNDVIVGLEHRRRTTGRVLGDFTGSPLDDPDANVVGAHLAAGRVPPYLKENLAAAQKAAESISPSGTAGAMVVTIGGPLPLPVTIAGGAPPGGGGGKPPTEEGGAGGNRAEKAAAAAKEPVFQPDPKKDVIFVSPGGRLGRTPPPGATYDPNTGASLPYQPGTGAGGIFRSATGEINMPGVRLPALRTQPPPLPGIQYEEQLLLPAQATDARARGARPLDTRGNYQRPVASFGQESGVVLEQRDRDLRMKSEERETKAAEKAAMQQAEKAAAKAASPQRTEEERKALAARAPSASRLDQLLRTATGNTQGLPVAEFDTSIYEEQEFQRAQQGARASLRQARGKLPQRALSTSIVQIAENLFGGIEKPLAKIAEAEQEFTQLGQIGRQRGAVEGNLILQRTQRDVVDEQRKAQRALPEGERKLDKKQLEELDAAYESLTDEIGLNERSLKKLTDLESEQAKKVQGLAESAVGASDVLRNLGAGFVGGVGGALVTQLVSQVAGAVMQGFQLAMPTLDRMLGGANVASQVQGGLAQAFTQGGFSQTAIRETLAQAGLTSETMARFENTVNANAEAVALANQMDSARNLLFTEQAIQGQMDQGSSGLLPAYYQQVGGVSLPNPLGGRLEWGGSDSPVKVFAGELRDAARVASEEQGYSQRDIGQAQWELEQARAVSNMNIDALNMQTGGDMPYQTDQELADLMQRGGVGMMGPSAAPPEAWDALLNGEGLISDRIMEALGSQIGEGYQIIAGKNEDQIASLYALGGQGGDLAGALKDLNLTLADSQGNAVTIDKLDEFLNATTGGGAGNIDVAGMASIMGNDINYRNELWAMAQGQARQVQMRQMGFAMQGMGNPVLSANQAAAPIQSGGYTRQYQQLAADVRAFENQGVEMLTALMPDELNQEYMDLGASLRSLNAESRQIARTQAWRQYEMSIKQAKYQVEDLRALTDKAGGSEIGMLERRNMLLQRHLQMLQFEQQQRAINFGVAVAGFQSAGLTGEERSARLEVARREAEIQQEMLDANKAIFNNQVTIVDARNIRQLELATLNLRNVAASFRENSRLSEIATLSELIGRRKNQIESQYNEQVQFWAQADEALTQFNKDLGNRTKTLASQVDVQEASTINFQGALEDMMKENDRLQELIKTGTTPGLIVRDITISPHAGMILDVKELVDIIIERMGNIFERIGGSD